MDFAVHIAAGQLAALRRHRRPVLADPLIGLLHDNPSWMLSTVLHASPGEPVDPAEIGPALAALREIFGAEGKKLNIELVDQASPGLADALVEHGVQVKDRPPLLAIDPTDLRLPDGRPEVSVIHVSTRAEHDDALQVANTAFGSDLRTEVRTNPVDGGTVLVLFEGVPAATAAWTAVAEGVTEIVGVATLPEYRRRGLARIATAHATDHAVRLAGATVPWLCPGDEGADRLYRQLGFAPVGSAVQMIG